ncbi:MAG: succinate dehydrogenase assembly factor 4 [Pseudomonadota bacterium]
MTERGRTIFEHEGAMPKDRSGQPKEAEPKADRDDAGSADVPPEEVEEIGGPKGPEPTRYGDWEKGGRCSDF